MNWLSFIRDVVIIILPFAAPLIFGKFIKTTINKNRSVEYFNIAKSIVALILFKNPDLNKDQIIDKALDIILQSIEGINPDIARRIAADAYVTLKSGIVK